MQGIMVNRKYLEFLQVFSTFVETYYLFTFSFLAFPFVWENSRKRKQKRKNRIFADFAVKRPFLSQIKRWFSVIYAYIGWFAPHPPVFGTRRVGQLSSEFFFIFLFFYFFIFVKYSDFSNSAFLPNFEHFLEYHIYFFFCIKFHSIYFWLFLCVRWRFMQLCGIVYYQSILNVLELNYRVFCINFRFLRKGKSIFEFKTRFCYIKIAVITRLSSWVVCEAFLLRGWVYSLLYTGVDIPYYGCARGYITYLRVIIIWERVQMLNFQYEKSDLCG